MGQFDQFFPNMELVGNCKISLDYLRTQLYLYVLPICSQAGWLAGWLATLKSHWGLCCTELGRPFGTSLNVVLWYKQIGLLYLMLRCIYGANTGLNFTISYTSRFTINKKNDFYTVTNKTKNV
jgi:hypothetical protein